MKTNTSVKTTAAAYSLKEAVLDAVSTLKSNGSFSAHDVTKQVRQSVNDGEYTLPGLEAPSGSSFKFNVNHDDVKEVVDSLLNDGTLQNLGLTNVDYSGPYRVFQFGSAVATTTAADTTTTDDADVDQSDSPVASRIKAYLNNVGSATLKQVQSMLKVNGVTCKDLATLADEIGLTVTVGTEGCFSTYTVSND